jgi:CheY-like chemotaxis protein
MFDLNGIEAAIRIRALLPQIKILLFSGQAATADLLERARSQGYEFEILAKPVHPQDLLSRLRAQ